MKLNISNLQVSGHEGGRYPGHKIPVVAQMAVISGHTKAQIVAV